MTDRLSPETLVALRERKARTWYELPGPYHGTKGVVLTVEERDALVAEVLAQRELFAAVDEWIDARNRLASLPYRPGSIGYTFVANQVERGVARIDAAYAATPLPAAPKEPDYA